VLVIYQDGFGVYNSHPSIKTLLGSGIFHCKSLRLMVSFSLFVIIFFIFRGNRRKAS